MKETGINGSVSGFSVDYDAIAFDDIVDIHKYLMKQKMRYYKTFRFFKQKIFSAMMFFGCNLSSVNPIQCVSISNQESKVRPEITNINSNELSFYPYSVKINNCSGSCNNINTSYAKMCVPDV